MGLSGGRGRDHEEGGGVMREGQGHMSNSVIQSTPVSLPGRLTLLGIDWGGGRGVDLGWWGGGAALGRSPDPSPLHFSSNWCGLVFIEYKATGF